MSRQRVFWMAVVLLLFGGFAAANAHLVAVAIGSQPDCVLDPSHQKGAANRAAKPSC